MPEITATIFAMLFAAAEPCSVAQLAEAAHQEPEAVESALSVLATDLARYGALQLVSHDGLVSLATAPPHAEAIQRLLRRNAHHNLSRAGLETLAIIAYRGPIAQTEIETIRGVASDATLRNLIGRGLISSNSLEAASGRRFVVTHDALLLLGLSSLDDLPPLPEEAST